MMFHAIPLHYGNGGYSRAVFWASNPPRITYKIRFLRKPVRPSWHPTYTYKASA